MNETVETLLRDWAVAAVLLGKQTLVSIFGQEFDENSNSNLILSNINNSLPIISENLTSWIECIG